MKQIFHPKSASPPAPAPLPLRDGVSASCVVLPSTRQPLWPTLLDALAARLPGVERAQWQQRLDEGDVCNAQGQPLSANSPPHSGQRVYYWRHVADEPELPFAHRVLYHDAHLVVADKPHFVPVTPAGRYARSSLLARLKRELGLAQLSPIHRIDRETAGLVVFAVRPQDRNTYQALFREQRVDKVYEAIAPTPKGDHDRGIWGQPWVHRSHICEDEHAFFRMREAPASEGKAPNSQTTLELVAQRGAFGLYRLCPLTGKRHQLRVHMSALGTPIHGDALYPVVRHLPAQAPPTTDPLRLLAKKLAFTDPLSGEKREFQSAFELEWPNAPA